MLGYFNTKQRRHNLNIKKDKFFPSFAVELNQERSINLSYFIAIKTTIKIRPAGLGQNLS
jgi:hypothetical protein